MFSDVTPRWAKRSITTIGIIKIRRAQGIYRGDPGQMWDSPKKSGIVG
jgi:hypothetical protein